MRSTRIAFSLLLFGICATAAGQWQPATVTSGPIYYNGGDTGIVGIGTSAPALQNGCSPGIMISGSYPAIRLFGTGAGARPYQISTGSSGQFTIIDGPTSSSRMMIDPSGQVGIGTSFPTAKLNVAGEVHATAAVTGDLMMRLWNSGAGGAKFRVAGAENAEGRSQYTHGPGYTAEIAVKNDAADAANNYLELRVQGISPNTEAGLAAANRLTVFGSGKVGVNTKLPTHTLDVNGTFRVRGDAVIDGNIAAKFQDLAEWVPSAEDLEPGTVVVLDPSVGNAVLASGVPYDTTVAGVVSAQPGIILGERGPSSEQIATTGRVRVKVDASRAPIRVGDLLVTSDKPGRAMKSSAVDVGGISIHRPGTILGKALEPLAADQGEILVLLSLQ